MAQNGPLTTITNHIISILFILSPFILMDGRGTCIAVSAYNVAVGKGVIVGDSVTIPEPFVQEINVSIGDEVSFK